MCRARWRCPRAGWPRSWAAPACRASPVSCGTAPRVHGPCAETRGDGPARLAGLEPDPLRRLLKKGGCPVLVESTGRHELAEGERGFLRERLVTRTLRCLQEPQQLLAQRGFRVPASWPAGQDRDRRPRWPLRLP